MDPFAVHRRAWLAYQCLPRDEKGQLPSIRGLELANKMSNAQLNKLLGGISKRPSYAELEKIAAALKTTVDFLHHGRGAPPVPTAFPAVPWPGPREKRAKRSIPPRVEASFEGETKKLSKSR